MRRWKEVEAPELSYTADGQENQCNYPGNLFGKYLSKLNAHISYYLMAPLLGIFPKEICIYIHRTTCIGLFIAAVVMAST